jgi:hypothetical protein
MRIRITQHTIAQKQQVNPGDELDVTPQEAAVLISVGRAIALPEQAETTSLPAAEKATGPKPEKPKPVQQAKAPIGASPKTPGTPAKQVKAKTSEEKNDGLP